MPEERSQSFEVLAVKIENMAVDVAEIKAALSKLTDGHATIQVQELKVEKAEEAIGRAFGEIKRLEDAQRVMNDDYETRLKHIETEIPQLKEMRTVVNRGIYGGLGMIALALAKMVVVDPMAQQKVVYVPTAPSAPTVITTPAAPMQPPVTINTK